MLAHILDRVVLKIVKTNFRNHPIGLCILVV